MPDEVNFLPEKPKKKQQSNAAGGIEYTEGEKNEPQVTLPSLADVEKNVEKTRQSFLEWRNARKQKRDEERARKAAERAAADRDRVEKKARADKEASEKRAHEAAARPIVDQQPQPKPQHSAAPQTVPEVAHPHVELKTHVLEPVVHKPVPAAAPELKAPIAHHAAPKKIHTAEELAHTAKKETENSVPEQTESITSVNLIPEALFEAMRSQGRFRDLIVTAGLMCALVMMVYTGLHLYAQKLSRDTHDVVIGIQNLDTEIATYEETRDAAQTQFDELAAVSDILNGHIQWTPFFEYIEKWTLPNVYYETMSGSAATGEFTFSVVTSDFRFVTAQIEVLRSSPMIASVTTTSATQDSSDSTTNTNGTNANTNAPASSTAVVSFTMTVHFKTELFHTTNTN